MKRNMFSTLENKDVEQASELIISSLRDTLKSYYPKKLIRYFCTKNSPKNILLRAKNEIDYFVAKRNSDIIGVIGLSKNKNIIRTFYIKRGYDTLELRKTMFDYFLSKLTDKNQTLLVNANPYNRSIYQFLGFKLIKPKIKTLNNIKYKEFMMKKEVKKGKFFWANEPNKLIFRSEIMIYPIIIDMFRLDGISKNKKVLDAGCGTGKLARLLASEGYKVFGVDKEKKAIDFARGKSEDIEYKIGDLTNLSKLYKKNSFDLIVCTFATLYLNTRELNKFVAECYKILKKGGGLIIADVHPFLPVIQFKTRWEKFYSKKINYFDLKMIEQDIFLPNDKSGDKRIKISAKWWHHSLEEYTKIFKKNSFAIYNLLEPKPSNHTLNQYVKMWHDEVNFPAYVIFETKKM